MSFGAEAFVLFDMKCFYALHVFNVCVHIVAEMHHVLRAERKIGACAEVEMHTRTGLHGRAPSFCFGVWKRFGRPDPGIIKTMSGQKIRCKEAVAYFLWCAGRVARRGGKYFRLAQVKHNRPANVRIRAVTDTANVGIDIIGKPLGIDQSQYTQPELPAHAHAGAARLCKQAACGTDAEREGTAIFLLCSGRQYDAKQAGNNEESLHVQLIWRYCVVTKVMLLLNIGPSTPALIPIPKL